MIDTARLILRGWRDGDAAAHRALILDPRVSATLGAAPVRDGSAEVMARQRTLQAAHGYCFWVVEDRASGAFLGWCGLKPGRPPIEGELEIGWTISPDRWGEGLAREAAEASLRFAWEGTEAPEVVAITSCGNARSFGLMERLGMRRCPDEDFDHPDLAPGNPLRPHVLYRLARPAGR